MTKDFDCVLCGSCVADLLVRPVPLEVPIGGGKLLRAEPIEVTTGGIVSNSGIAMARLGMKVAAFTYVGNDDWAALIRRRLENGGRRLRPAADPSDRRHQHHGRVDRSERRTQFRPLRRCAEADGQKIVSR